MTRGFTGPTRVTVALMETNRSTTSERKAAKGVSGVAFLNLKIVGGGRFCSLGRNSLSTRSAATPSCRSTLSGVFARHGPMSPT